MTRRALLEKLVLATALLIGFVAGFEYRERRIQQQVDDAEPRSASLKVARNDYARSVGQEEIR